jgi:HlyD family secretion protein
LDYLKAEGTYAAQINKLSTQLATLEKKLDYERRMQLLTLEGAVETTERDLQQVLKDNQAELEQASRNLARATELREAQIATASDLETAQYQHDVASASYEQAQVSLERARRNLEYTEIRAPIDGVVIQRAVEVGQTVAASMSAPTLFVLAGDLGEMEILASVDESDIGMITHGQEVRFTVQAFPEESFSGTVSQVRLQSAVVENVVTYDVVIDVDNVDGELLPGMTATAAFVVDRAEDILKVSNSALRFSPTEAMISELAELRERDGAVERSPPDVSAEEQSTRSMPEGGRSGGRTGQSPNAGQSARLYFLNENGELTVARVGTGLTDGQSTVIEGPGVSGGLKVIAAVSSNTSTTAASNPFQSQSGSRPPGGPRG